MKRRNLILLLGGASSGAMSVGTGAFSSMEAERGVSVSVENDKDAYIRYEKPNNGAETECGEEITLVRVRNQFGGNQALALVGVEYEDEGVDGDVLNNVTVERYESSEDPDEELNEGGFTDVSEDHVAIERGSAGDDYPSANDDDAFGPGEWVRIVADACVPPGESVDIEVTITVQGVEGSVSAQLFGDTRQFTLHSKEDNTADLVSYVKFPGKSGKVQIRTDSDNGGAGDQTVTATAYYLTSDNTVRTAEGMVEIDTQLELEDDFGVSEFDSIVGIEIAGITGVFVHPDFEECDVSNGGGSGNPGGEVDVSTDLPTEDEAFGSCLEDD